MVMNENGNKKMYQYQVGYMPNSKLDINKAQQVENNTANTFNYTIMTFIKKMMRNDNTRVLSLLMF